MENKNSLTSEELIKEIKKEERLASREYPVELQRWVRFPQKGLEPYTGMSRAMAYKLAEAGLIKTSSPRLNPNQKRAGRYFWLPSILKYLDTCAEDTFERYQKKANAIKEAMQKETGSQDAPEASQEQKIVSRLDEGRIPQSIEDEINGIYEEKQ